MGVESKRVFHSALAPRARQRHVAGKPPLPVLKKTSSGDPHFPPTLPERISLISQTTDILRNGIEAGRWNRFLPGERELAALLRVSRPTVRAALSELESSGWLRTSQGRRREILARPKATNKPVPQTRTVFLLSPQPLDAIPPSALFWIDEVRSRLSEKSWALEVVSRPSAYQSRPEKVLEDVVGNLPAAAWLLYVSTEAMQRWFANRGIPALVVGSSPPDNPLPSVDVDYRAACRHAAQWLSNHGHQRLALLLPKSGTPGDLESETGFREGAENTRVERHDGTAENVCRRLDKLLASGRTGFLVARSAQSLTALTHLQRRGLTMPGEVAVISRDDDTYLRHAVPALARYTSAAQPFAKKVGEALLQLLENPVRNIRPVRIMPEFYRGETAG